MIWEPCSLRIFICRFWQRKDFGGNPPIWNYQYRKMRPDVARDALLATHGGLSLEWCATICHISPMALYRVICAFGQHSLVSVLTRCGLRLPAYILADAKHSRCLTDKV